MCCHHRNHTSLTRRHARLGVLFTAALMEFEIQSHVQKIWMSISTRCWEHIRKEKQTNNSCPGEASIQDMKIGIYK